MTNEELLKKISEAKESKATALDLSGNDLTTLPPELFQLTNLTWLNLSGNRIAALSPEISQLANLTSLHLSGNQLTALPTEIWQLTKLNNIYLSHNPLPIPPPEITLKGIEAIRDYFINLQTGERPLNEVKIILVGDGAAGKTSLVKQLLGEEFNPHEDTTHGINIRGWDVEAAGGQQIKVNIWDFGGQEIQHATHQFFLSQRSLYVLVLDPRKDDRAEYWLRYIEAFGGDSPILVVLNKIDSNPSFDLNRTFLREKYHGIRDFLCTSCKNGDGIASFKRALLAELVKMPMLGIHWPIGRVVVKRKLEQMEKHYINADEYKNYCAEAGIAGEDNRETLIDFLNDLGVAVHFKDFILDAMHVLNPVWVTNAVYAVITADQMDGSKGLLRLKNLGKILPQPEGEQCDYPLETHPYIVTLMKKFGLCYAIGEETVLIPQLLPVPEPEFIFDYNGSLRFTFYYPDFLPPSLFPRFVVKVYKDIKVEVQKIDGQKIKEYLRWRTGVVLEDSMSGTRAVVKTDIEARRINIWVHGERRRDYLHYLRYLLIDINTSFEKLTVSECVPMPDDPARTADYENLLNLAKAKSDIFIPIGSNKKYSVRELLGLVQPQDANELAVLTEKVGMKPDEKKTFLERFTSVIEMKVMLPPFIDVNISELFKQILEWNKQRHEKRRG